MKGSLRNTRELICSKLQVYGIPNSIVRDFPPITGDCLGVLIYGSRARGDALSDSDLDVIEVVRKNRRSTYQGLLSISYYTLAQLKTGISTLFGAHLKQDAKILWDPTGKLETVVGQLGKVDVDRLLSRSLAMSCLFTTPQTDLPKYLPGLLREARYLLRSCMYAQAIQEGEPCFSVRELARKHSDTTLAELLASRQKRRPNLQAYELCVAKLGDIVGHFPDNPWGSLESLVVNEWGAQSDTLSMAFMALSTSIHSGDYTDYAEVEKILL